jgi:hypothetical protein
MAVKLGEMLIEAGLLTPVQLVEALKNQVNYGGRLGTNLIDMGFLEEEDLDRFLSKKLGLPCATDEQLRSVSPDIIALFPKELVEKYSVIPLRRENKRLTLAMLDPSDLSVMDEISFVTGYFIIPMVAPELRLLMALEKYYDIKRNFRFVQISNKIMEQRRLSKQDEIDAKAFHEADLVDSSKQQEEEFIEIMDEIVASAEPLSVEPPIMEPVEEEPPEQDSANEEIVMTGPAGFTFESLFEALAEVKDREEIADMLIAFLGQEFYRVALFMVKGTVVGGWRALRDKKVVPGIENLQISLEVPSVLKIVIDGKSFYLGAIPDAPENTRILSELGGDAPVSALLVPMMLMGRVVAIVYVDRGKEPVANRLADLQKLAGKAAMAFEILILKNKILMT